MKSESFRALMDVLLEVTAVAGGSFVMAVDGGKFELTVHLPEEKQLSKGRFNDKLLTAQRNTSRSSRRSLSTQTNVQSQNSVRTVRSRLHLRNR